MFGKLYETRNVIQQNRIVNMPIPESKTLTELEDKKRKSSKEYDKGFYSL